jgi:A/G-specific adenine glycosylase
MGINEYHLESVSPVYKQQLTHQNLSGQFIAVDISVIPESLLHMQKIEQNALQSLAFPKFINQYLQDEADSKAWQPLLF